MVFIVTGSFVVVALLIISAIVAMVLNYKRNKEEFMEGVV